MMLRDLAHVRTGDKGNISQISVIAYRTDDFPLLAREVTVERVVAALRGLSITAARRYELAEIGALNFVLEGALGGGVTRSLSLDAHGKTLGAQILAMELPDEAAE